MSTELPKSDDLVRQLFSINNEEDFTHIALNFFRFQYGNNSLYKRFADLMGSGPAKVKGIADIPFLPISFFKTHPVQSTEFSTELIFQSSGTTGNQTSRHWIKEPAIYTTSFVKAFELFYGSVKDYCFLALLPSYLERGDSSLIYMVKSLMEISGHPSNGFFLYDLDGLAATLAELEKRGQKTLLIGVTYALLDFAAAHPIPLKNSIVMETGGMKGRKKEVVRSEVHQFLKDSFSVEAVHSEYGMTELLSQAYARAEGKFLTPPWMKVLIREEDDPKALTYTTEGRKAGAINVIDLANLYSCSFIATEDVGNLYDDGSFEVLGRLDNSDIRGCSLLAL